MNKKNFTSLFFALTDPVRYTKCIFKRISEVFIGFIDRNLNEPYDACYGVEEAE